MKLIVIGRNAQEADLVLASDYVSNYHAEIIQLDNGDMYIVDKSANGTYVNGSRLTPGKETPLRRGDHVEFADVPLDWSRIQDNPVSPDVKQVKSIGSHYMNNISIQGPNVSRFHATLRQMKDGKWYICDHSKNGTTVNGKKLPKDRDVLLKKGDTISCAGVPVENPVKATSTGLLVGIGAAAACLVLGIVFGISAFYKPKYTDMELCQKYDKSIVLMVCDYHFKVTCGTLDISDLPDPDSYNPTTGRFYDSMYDEFYIEGNYIYPFAGSDGTPVLTATGFFVGDDVSKGYIATNRHVAKPWESETILYGDGDGGKPVTILTAAENYYRAKLTKLYALYQKYGIDSSSLLQYISQIKVEGVLDDVVVVPNGSFFNEQNMFICHEVACGNNPAEDVALFQLSATNKPNGISSIPWKMIKANVPPTQGMHCLTIGFPFGLGLQDNIKGTAIQALNPSGNITQTNSKHSFVLTAASYHGASGSPVFDEHGQLIGVLNAGVAMTQGFNNAIRSEYLTDLMKKNKIK